MESQRLQMERQIQMQQLIQERMMAMNVARARDIAYYLMIFTSAVGIVGIPMTVQKKNPVYIFPMFPLAFVWHYFYDLGFGNKLTRQRKYAEELLASKPELVALPKGPITFDEIEECRRKLKLEAEKFEP